jgi:transposase
MPLVEAIRGHVLAAERIHADDTTVPVLAKGKTRIGRLWTYVRDDRPFAGPIRRERCFSIPGIVAASIPGGIWQASPG